MHNFYRIGCSFNRERARTVNIIGMGENRRRGERVWVLCSTSHKVAYGHMLANVLRIIRMRPKCARRCWRCVRESKRLGRTGHGVNCEAGRHKARPPGLIPSIQLHESKRLHTQKPGGAAIEMRARGTLALQAVS